MPRKKKKGGRKIRKNHEGLLQFVKKHRGPYAVNVYSLPEDDNISMEEYTAGSFSAKFSKIYLQDGGLIVCKGEYAIFNFVASAIGPVIEVQPGIVTFAYVNIVAAPEDFTKPLQVFVINLE